ncbi:hypothetical protein V6R21_04825 [Limibacter armeniacum]|uniref:hypothetical protein n=1 Tax=Limibacter armeniacum TaxID=466084 RepID=UPI002FE612E0
MNELERKQRLEDAASKLEIAPYDLRNLTQYKLAVFFARFYHVISFLLASLCIGFIALDKSAISLEGSLAHVAMAVGSLLLLAMVIGINEFAKAGASSSFFKRKNQTEGKVNVPSAVLAALIGTILISVITSSLGGYFFAVNQKDQSEEISTSYESKEDAVNKYYESRISSVRDEIQFLRNDNAYKKQYWDTSKNNWAFGQLTDEGKEAILKKEAELTSLRSEYQDKWNPLTRIFLLIFQLTPPLPITSEF